MRSGGVGCDPGSQTRDLHKSCKSRLGGRSGPKPGCDDPYVDVKDSEASSTNITERIEFPGSFAPDLPFWTPSREGPRSFSVRSSLESLDRQLTGSVMASGLRR